MKRILIVEDEPDIQELLRAYLEDAGYQTAVAGDGVAALALFGGQPFDLVLLDLGLPDMDGLDIVKTVRTWSSVPIIILSARGQEKLKVECLDVGADDYVTKPFGVDELLARMNAALRRATLVADDRLDPVFETGSLRVDLSARQVFVGGKEVRLTPLEYRLLTVLIQHAGKVVTQRQLLTEVWGPEYADEAQYLRVYIGYLRRKLGSTSSDDSIILTEARVGYRLVV